MTDIRDLDRRRTRRRRTGSSPCLPLTVLARMAPTRMAPTSIAADPGAGPRGTAGRRPVAPRDTIRDRARIRAAATRRGGRQS